MMQAPMVRGRSGGGGLVHVFGAGTRTWWPKKLSPAGVGAVNAVLWNGSWCTREAGEQAFWNVNPA